MDSIHIHKEVGEIYLLLSPCLFRILFTNVEMVTKDCCFINFSFEVSVNPLSRMLIRIIHVVYNAVFYILLLVM